MQNQQQHKDWEQLSSSTAATDAGGGSGGGGGGGGRQEHGCHHEKEQQYYYVLVQPLSTNAPVTGEYVLLPPPTVKQQYVWTSPQQLNPAVMHEVNGINWVSPSIAYYITTPSIPTTTHFIPTTTHFIPHYTSQSLPSSSTAAVLAPHGASVPSGSSALHDNKNYPSSCTTNSENHLGDSTNSGGMAVLAEAARRHNVGVEDGRILVLPSDQTLTTNYCYTVMKQMVMTSFKDEEHRGKKSHIRTGFPGIACLHCNGEKSNVNEGGSGNSSSSRTANDAHKEKRVASGLKFSRTGRYFPCSLKNFSDQKKMMNAVYKHLVKCSKCPASVKEQLVYYKTRHKEEMKSLWRGSQALFLKQLWERLHGERIESRAKKARTSLPTKNKQSKR